MIISNNFHNTDREKSFLNRLIEKPSLLNSSDVDKDDFFSIQHGLIFNCIGELFDNKKRVTPTSIVDKLNCDENEIISIIRSANHEDFKVLSDSIINARVRRSIDSLGKSMLESNQNGLDGIKTLNSYIDKLAAVNSKQNIDTVVNSSIHAQRALESITSTDKLYMIPTGIKSLDDATGGLARGLVTIVGALGGMGKSAFLTNLYHNIANQGLKVLFVSLEDDAIKIHLRMISRLTRIQSKRLLQHKKLSEFELENCHESAKMLHFKECYVDDSTNQTPESIKRVVNRLISRHGLDVVICDHIGEMVRGGDVYNKTSDAIKELRDIALDCNVAMLVASQLSRKITERTDPIPMKSDLRDSGKLEEVARNIWLLHRPSYFDQTGGDDHDLQVIVDKASHGTRGMLHLDVDLDTMDISDRINR